MRTPKPTIAQQRAAEVVRLAERKNATPTDEDLKDAQKIMNSFYRLCALDEWLLYAENDERRHDSPLTQKEAAKAERWRERLAAYLDPYGLKIVYFGFFPTICEKDTTATAIYSYFYK